MKSLNQMRLIDEGNENAKFYDKIFENEINFTMKKIEANYE